MNPFQLAHSHKKGTRLQRNATAYVALGDADRELCFHTAGSYDDHSHKVHAAAAELLKRRGFDQKAIEELYQINRFN